MQHVFDYPLPCAFDGGLIVCVPVTITAEIEPDETLGDTDYYISSLWIEGTKSERGKLADAQDDHRIPDTDPMAEVIRHYAYKTHKRQLDELWQRHLRDLPKTRRA